MTPRSADRMRAVADAALAVFTARGFRQAQMADVAREAGVSAGSLYALVSDKDALLKLALLAAFGRDVATLARPLPAQATAETIAMLTAFIDAEMTWPVLAAAAAQPSVGGEAALGAVLREGFDLLARRRRLIWLLDRLALELEPFREVHIARLKRPYLVDLTRYLAAHARPHGDPALLARAVVESLAWFAMHRHRDLALPPITDDEAFATVAGMISDGIARR